MPEVRLIGPGGENMGVVPIRQAIQIARDAEMDLVEVSPNASHSGLPRSGLWKVPVRTREERARSQKAQTKIEVKEIRLRPKTNEHHRGFKVDDARRWLLQGHKVRVTIRFRGREMDYPELALEDLKEIAQSLSDVSVIEQPPMIEGRTMLVVLGPARNKPSKKAEKSAESPA